jgi:hypothetical protein
MKIWFAWVGHKRDSSGKSHLWGILYRESEETEYNVFSTPSQKLITRKYICWGSAKNRAYMIEPIVLVQARSRKLEKIAQGYKEITQDKIEREWPEFMNDIEMQFIMEKLTQ